MLRLYDLTLEYLDNPIGIDVPAPRFSWKLESDQKDTLQTAYELRINGKPVSHAESGQSTLVAYTGEALKPRSRYSWGGNRLG